MESINNARAIREAAAYAGTSLLEMAQRLGCSAQRLEHGTFPLELVAKDADITMEQIRDMGRD